MDISFPLSKHSISRTIVDGYKPFLCLSKGMRLIGIAAPPSDLQILVDKVATFLSTQGSLAIISPLAIENSPKQIFSTYQLDEKGNWSASGGGLTLTHLFEKIATTHDYAIISGFENANLPYLSIKGSSHAGTSLMELTSVDNLDTDQLFLKLNKPASILMLLMGLNLSQELAQQ